MRRDFVPIRTRRSRELRSRMTVQEVRLWVRLQRRGLSGYKFRRQQPIGPYIVDFYCAELQFAIELDGGHHFEAEQREYDKHRDQYIRAQGVIVIRYPNSDVDEDIDAVLEDLLQRVRRRRRDLPAPQQARGTPPLARRGSSGGRR